MNLVSELDLPEFDYPAPDVPADRDFVAAVARPYPSLTIAAVVGAPRQDAGR
jgi:hypothetical protein